MQNLIDIQAVLKVPKGNLNKFDGYHYRSAEDILTAVKPLLAEKGLMLTINDDLVNIGNRYYVKSTAKIVDGKENIEVTAFAREDETKKGMDVSQITGLASSYARKCALNGLFLLDDIKDADTFEPEKYVREWQAKL
jgi:hypothetical protein